MFKADTLTIADFFAGIGLVSLGFIRKQWTVAYAVDYSDSKRLMYEAHFGNEHYFVSDIADISGKDVPSVTLAHASFPCTDTSVAGGRLGLDEGLESAAVWSFLRILGEMQDRRPPLVMMENVEGFLTSHNGQDIRTTLQVLNELGYAVDVLSIDAANFVPQSRVRLFIIGVLNSNGQGKDERESILSEPHKARPEKIKQFIRSNPDIKWRIEGIPSLPQRTLSLDSIIDETEEWWPEERAAYLYEQMVDRHKTEIHRMMEGQQYSYGTVFRRMRVRNGIKLSTAELRTDGIAGCLRTPKGGSARQILVRAGKGQYNARLLNARECARLMGADDFIIPEDLGLNQALFGFGDAVCVSVIEWLVEHYFNPLINQTSMSNGILPHANESEALGSHKDVRKPNEADVLTEEETRIFQAFLKWCKKNTEKGEELPVRGRSYAALVTLDRLKRNYDTNPQVHATANGSSVLGLTAHRVKQILSQYGEERSIPSEAGRTSRGTLRSVENLLSSLDTTSLGSLEQLRRITVIEHMIKHLVWVVGEYHERARLQIEFDPSKNAVQVLSDLITTAGNKAGAVVQHLVGAKLQIRYPELSIENHAFSTADVQTGRRGDFQINDTVFHVTVSATPGHLAKCAKDVREGLKVYLLVKNDSKAAIEPWAHKDGDSRICVAGIESFVGQNLDELSEFSRKGFERQFRELLEVYNRRVSQVEADKSLLIEIPNNLQ